MLYIFLEIGAFMKMNSKKKKIIISCCALVLVATIIVAIIFLPGTVNKEVKTNSYVAKTQTGIAVSDAFDVTIKGSDNKKMLVNSKNGAVAFVSDDGKVVFNSCSIDAAEQQLASVLSLRLRDKIGNSYIMNSTDNSVSFGTFRVVAQSNIRTNIEFNFFPDDASAKKGVKKFPLILRIIISKRV